MNYLVIFLLIALSHSVSADGSDDKDKEANQPVYQAVRRPYNYRQYGVDAYAYDDDSYRRYDDPSETYGAYPAAFDLGAQRLHLSGGIFRPYGYDDGYVQNVGGYKPYAYDNAQNAGGYKPYAYDNSYRYYDSSASGYARYPHTQYKLH